MRAGGPQPRSRRHPETGLVHALLEYLTLRGHFAWRQNTMPVPIVAGPRSDRRFVGFRKAPIRGVSDILGCLGRRIVHAPSGATAYERGTLFAIEAKMPGGRIRPEQKSFLESVRASGGIAVVAYGIEDLRNAGL